MTPKQKKEYNTKIQAAMSDLKEVMVKHQCIITFDTMSASMSIMVNTDSKVVEQLSGVMDTRWRGSVYQGNNLLYESVSPELQKFETLTKKIEQLMMVIDPTEYTQVLMRITAGEDAETILAEYQDRIDEHEKRIKAIDDDPTRLLADFNDIDLKDKDIEEGI
jgi:hypothetical protein